MKFQQYRKAIVTTILSIGALSSLLLAQVPKMPSDADQIVELMKDLCTGSKTPTDALDPSLSPSERNRNVSKFGAQQFELTLVPTHGIPAITGDSASVPVRVHFKSESGDELDTGSTAEFVRRNGTWYFANFEFMAWPVFLVVVFVICMATGIGYAAIVLILRSRLVKKGRLGVNVVKIFLPFFWPSLFRETR